MIRCQFVWEQLRWVDSSLDCPPLDAANDNFNEDEQLHRVVSSFESPHFDSDKDLIEEDVEISQALGYRLVRM